MFRYAGAGYLCFCSLTHRQVYKLLPLQRGITIAYYQNVVHSSTYKAYRSNFGLNTLLFMLFSVRRYGRVVKGQVQ